MASKLLGVLTTSSSQVTVERTDGGGASGPHLISLADGDWYMRAVAPGVIDSSSGSTNTVSVVAGHEIAVGHVIDVWDSNGGDAALASSRTVTASSATSITFDGAAIAVAISDLVFVSDDLLGYFRARIVAQDKTNLGNFTISVSSAGLISMAMGSTRVLVVTWTTTDVRDWMRYTGTLTITGNSESEVNTRPHVGGVYLDKDVESDFRRIPPAASQSRAVGGQIETIYRAQFFERSLRFQAQGPPRATTETQVEAVKDFFATHASRGKRFLYFPDASVDTAYVRVTNPRGYDELVAIGDLSYREEPIAPGFAGYLRYTVETAQYVAP
jgi:hypothetical protein